MNLEFETPELLSVIVPMFNCADFVSQTIASIQAQTYAHFELILVDDGSSDDTVSIAENYAEGDDRISIIRLAENVGPAGARNRGLSQASGNFVKFFDADDIMHPQNLEVCLEVIGEYDALITNFKRIRDNTDISFDSINGPLTPCAGARVVITQGVGVPRVFYRRELLLRSNGFDESLVNNEDHELNYRLLCMGANFGYEQIDLMYYRQHQAANRVTRRLTRFEESLQAKRIMISRIADLPTSELKELARKHLANSMGYIGVNLARRGKSRLGREVISEAKALSPQIVVSRNPLYNLANRIIGVGTLDLAVGAIYGCYRSAKN